MKLYIVLVIMAFSALQVRCLADGDTPFQIEHYEMPPGETNVVAREVHLEPHLSYSGAFYYLGHRFSPPKKIDMIFYGYHDKEEWSAIKSVVFSYNGKTIKISAKNQASGPDRDRSGDTEASNYFEELAVEIPTSIAEDMIAYGSVSVSTEPEIFTTTLTDAPWSRFQKLVGSVKNLKATIAQFKATTGIPLTEVFDDPTGDTTIETDATKVAPLFTIQGMSMVKSAGSRMKNPLSTLLVLALHPSPMWAKNEPVILTIGERRLRLYPNAQQVSELDGGGYCEVMTVRMPAIDFQLLAKTGTFQVTIANETYKVPMSCTAGLRALAAKVKR